jgi:hypothetical protein
MKLLCEFSVSQKHEILHVRIICQRKEIIMSREGDAGIQHLLKAEGNAAKIVEDARKGILVHYCHSVLIFREKR